MVGNGSLQDVFSDCTCSKVRMIVISFLYHYYYYYYYYGNVQTNGVIHGEKSEAIERSRLFPYISYTHVFTGQFVERRVNKVSDHSFPTVQPYSSLSLPSLAALFISYPSTNGSS